MGGGGSQNTTTTGTTEPWKPQQPYLTYGLGEAQRLYQNAPRPSRLPSSAGSQLGSTISGGYLGGPDYGSNPYAGAINPNLGTNPYAGAMNPFVSNTPNAYIDQLAGSIASDVVPGVMSQYAGAGRSGTSPVAQESMARGITAALAPHLFGSAENQMNRMFGAGESALDRGMSASEADLARRYSAGEAALGRGYSASEAALGREYGGYQSERDRMMAGLGMAPSIFSLEANAPWQQLSNYAGLVAGNYGGTQTGVSSGRSGK